MRKKLKFYYKHNQLNTKEDSSTRNEGTITKKAVRHRRQIVKDKSLLISNYFKYRKIKHSSQKTEIYGMDYKTQKRTFCITIWIENLTIINIYAHNKPSKYVKQIKQK